MGLTFTAIRRRRHFEYTADDIYRRGSRANVMVFIIKYTHSMLNDVYYDKSLHNPYITTGNYVHTENAQTNVAAVYWLAWK